MGWELTTGCIVHGEGGRRRPVWRGRCLSHPLDRSIQLDRYIKAGAPSLCNLSSRQHRQPPGERPGSDEGVSPARWAACADYSEAINSRRAGPGAPPPRSEAPGGGAPASLPQPSPAAARRALTTPRASGQFSQQASLFENNFHGGAVPARLRTAPACPLLQRQWPTGLPEASACLHLAAAGPAQCRWDALLHTRGAGRLVVVARTTPLACQHLTGHCLPPSARQPACRMGVLQLLAGSHLQLAVMVHCRSSLGVTWRDTATSAFTFPLCRCGLLPRNKTATWRP